MSDCCSAPGLLPFEQALANMLSQVSPITETLTLPIEQALHYVLAQDIVSPLNVPPHDNSAMDGYAFAIESLIANKTLTLVGRSMAGSPFQGTCQSGECVRIMTGAKMPDCCDSVEMQENVNADGEQITFLQDKRFGSHVRNAGLKCQTVVIRSRCRKTLTPMASTSLFYKRSVLARMCEMLAKI